MENIYRAFTIEKLLKVHPGQEYIFETWIKYVSGTDTDQRLYMGASFYDENKSYLGNSYRYWGESALQVDANSRNDGWYHTAGTLGPNQANGTGSIPTAARWMKLIMLVNYSNNANTIRLCGTRCYHSGGIGKQMITSLYRKKIGSTAGSNAGDWVGTEVIDSSGNFYINSSSTNTSFLGDTSGNLTIANSGNINFRANGSSINSMIISSSLIDINELVDIDPPTANPALSLGRYSGQTSIRANTDDGGYLIMDSQGGWGAINWYTSDNVALVQGGGKVLVGSGTGNLDTAYSMTIVGGLKIGDTGLIGASGDGLAIRKSSDDFIRLVRSSVRTWIHRVASNGHYYIRNVDGSANVLTLTDNNRMGVMTTEPDEALSVVGNIFLQGNDDYIAFNTSASSGHPKIQMDSLGAFSFKNTADLVSLKVNNSGTVDLNYGTGQTVLVKGGTMNFGIPGNGSNVNGRFCTIEGNTDASGEGSSRIFFAEHNSSTAAKEKYGMSLGYRGGGTTLPSGFTGLTQIGNGQWGMWGHDNSQAGSLIMSGTRSASQLKLLTDTVEMKSQQRRVKLSVWSGSTYGFGMEAGYNFGGLVNEYAITCQMSNTNNRGWWWGDTAHTKSQGAFAVTTMGKGTLAHSLRIGYGESDTTAPGATYVLDVSGSAQIDGTIYTDRVAIGIPMPSHLIDVYTSTSGVFPARLVYAGTSGSDCALFLRLAGGSTSPSYVDFVYGTAQTGAITTNGSSTFYLTSSDYRLKENVVELNGALDRIDNLQPKRFNFIGDSETTVDGFLAHEVAEVVPEAIHGQKDAVDEDGNIKAQGIDQAKLVPLLVAAVQELRAEVELLKSQINS